MSRRHAFQVNGPVEVHCPFEERGLQGASFLFVVNCPVGAGALSGLLACQGQLHGEMQLSVILDFGGDIELTTVNLFNQFGMLLFVEGVHLEQNNAYYSTKSR